MACWQTELPRRGKSRLEGRSDRSLLSQRLEHQEGVGQHDQGQVAMRAVPNGVPESDPGRIRPEKPF